MLQNDVKRAFDKIHAEDNLKRQTINYLNNEIHKRKKQNHLFIFKKYTVLAAVLLVMFIIGAFSLDLYTKTVTFIDIDVNPSVEMAVNKYGRIVDIFSYNKEGDRVIAHLKVKNKPYDVGAKLVLERMQELGYIGDDATLSMTLQSNDSEKQGTMLNILKNVVKIFMDKCDIKTNTNVFSVSEEIKHSSHLHQLSPAKYLAITELQEVDPTATFEGCRHYSIGELENMTHGHMNGHGGITNDQPGNLSVQGDAIAQEQVDPPQNSSVPNDNIAADPSDTVEPQAQSPSSYISDSESSDNSTTYGDNMVDSEPIPDESQYTDPEPSIPQEEPQYIPPEDYYIPPESNYGGRTHGGHHGGMHGGMCW